MDDKLRKSQLALALMATLTLGANVVQAEDVTGVSQESGASVQAGDEQLVNAETVIADDATAPLAETQGAEEPLTQPVSSADKSGATTSPSTGPTEAIVSASSPATNVEQAVEGDQVDLAVLSTTDLHTNLVNYDYYQDKTSQTVGLAKTAVLIDQARAEKDNVILVDNGDIIQGTPLGTYKATVDRVEDGEDHPMYLALEQLGFDAGTLGNHEFNYGLDYLRRVMASIDFPIVNANVLNAQTGDNYFRPYTILEKHVLTKGGKRVPLKIGITGIVPPQIMTWDKANLEGKVTVKDAVQALQEVVPQMRNAGADVVVVLSHSGIGNAVYEVGEENVGYQIANLPGVDAVVTGHSHAEFPSVSPTNFYANLPGVDMADGTIHGVPVTMAGKYGDHLGVIDLKLTYADGKWQVTDSQGAIRKIDTRSDAANQEVVNLAQEAHQGTIQYVREQVGQTTAPINSYFALVKDDPSVQIVNNAQIWYAQQELAGTDLAGLPILSAAAPFKAGTRGDATAYTDIPTGPIAIKNVADLYLYDNVTAVIKVTGAQLREWLEMSAGQFNRVDPNSSAPQNLINTNYRTYNFDVIDGVEYEYDITQPNKYNSDGDLVDPTASRLRNLTYQGQPVRDDQEFVVVSNNYRASGNFPGVRDASVKTLLNLENRQAIINYILAVKTINPSADNNWSFASTIDGLDLRFQTADRAKTLVSGPDIAYLDGEEGGFGNYRFIYVPRATPVDPEDSQSKIELTGGRTETGQKREAVTIKVTYNRESYKALAEQHRANSQRLPEAGDDGGWLAFWGSLLLGGALWTSKRRHRS